MKFISWNVNGIRACVGKDFEESFKNAGFEEVTFNYIQTDIINVDYFRQHFDKAESDQMTTKQLYNIAKTFIQTVKKAGSNL